MLLGSAAPRSAAALQASAESVADDWYEEHPSFPSLVRPPPPPPLRRTVAGGRAPAARQQQRVLPPWYDPCGDAAAEIFRAQREGYTSAVDSWSLGVILYVLFTGMMPFYEDRHRPQVAMQCLLRFFDLTSQPWPEVSVAVRQQRASRGRLRGWRVSHVT